MIWPCLKHGYLTRVEQTDKLGNIPSIFAKKQNGIKICLQTEICLFPLEDRTILILRGGAGELIAWVEKYNI